VSRTPGRAVSKFIDVLERWLSHCDLQRDGRLAGAQYRRRALAGDCPRPTRGRKNAVVMPITARCRRIDDETMAGMIRVIQQRRKQETTMTKNRDAAPLDFGRPISAPPHAEK